MAYCCLASRSILSPLEALFEFLVYVKSSGLRWGYRISPNSQAQPLCLSIRRFGEDYSAAKSGFKLSIPSVAATCSIKAVSCAKDAMALLIKATPRSLPSAII